MGWSDCIGHEHLARWFQKQIRSGRLPHAYLFEGPEGVGKKRMALALAQAVNCEDEEGAGPCGACASCRAIADRDSAALMVYEDLGGGRWVSRREAISWAGSEANLLEAYAHLLEGGFLEPPVPAAAGEDRWDRLFLSPDKIIRRDPRATLDELAGVGGDEVSDPACRVGARLFRLPRSLVYYRRSLGIDLVTPRARSETLRTVQGFLSRRRLEGRRKVVIIDDAHKMTEEAQNCLLKTLEEPPEDSLLILILDSARRLLETIRSRCQGVGFGTVPVEALSAALASRGFSAGEARWAAERSGGRFSEAIQSNREEFLEAREEILHTWDGICRGDLPGLLEQAGRLSHEEIAERDTRVRKVRDELDLLLTWIRDLLFVVRGAPRGQLANADLADCLARESVRVSPEDLERTFWVIAGTAGELDRNVDLRLALEGMVLALPTARMSRSTAPRSRDAVSG